MKKNDLIRLLQQTPGNPEIKLWNGYVSDFMNVGGLVESDLVKMTKEYFLETLRLEKCSDLKDWDVQLTPEEIEDGLACYRRNYEWETNDYVTLDDIKQKRYARRRIVYINAKPRGKTMRDRLGSVSY